MTNDRRRSLRNKKIWITAILILSLFTAYSQQKEQVWLDFQVDYPFANKYLFEAEASYQTVLTKDRWRSLSLNSAFEIAILTRFDLIAEMPMSFTLQQEGSNSIEISPVLGTRYYITQNKRIDSRLVFKYQQRYFWQVENEDFDISNRMRLKGEVWFSITGPNLFTDKLLYSFIDYEEFFVLDKQLDERYANRRRGRMGLGYRLNYKNRFEFIYTMQSSRNEIEGEFNSIDNVLQFRYKMFLNPAKPASSDP
jgi:hypothetical protein